MSVLHSLLANGKINFPLLSSNIKQQVEPQHLAMET